MGLPDDKSAWPPAEHTERYSRMKTTSTWYGGSAERLKQLYGGDVADSNRGKRNWLSNAFNWLWGRTDPTRLDEKLHVPVAQDIATLSSEMLFARSPKFVVQHTKFAADGTPSPEQDAAVAKTQARLDVLLDSCGLDATLLAAGEVASALGSTGMKLAWNKGVIDKPVIVRVDADAVIPEYTWGQLTAVTFWSIVKSDGETKWFHLERHEPGVIRHGLYKGTTGNLGKRVPLAELPQLAELAQLVGEDGESILTVPDAITGISVPNMLPDPLDRTANAGRSDFTPGVLQLFDAIDKTYTSLMRDIDDGKSRLLVADYMLESQGIGKGVGFDEEQHLFTRLKMQPSDSGDAPISQVQFSIRVAEHIAAIDQLTQTAVKSAGYSPQSLGDYEAGSAMTATEVAARERKSISTTSKKQRYWQELERLLYGLLQIDATYFASGIEPLPVKIEWQAPASDSMKTLAETVKLMKEAEAASLRVRVAALHPDWDDSEVDEEVTAIQSESSAVDPTTFGLPKPPADVNADDATAFSDDDAEA